jgi:hypothetical protein
MNEFKDLPDRSKKYVEKQLMGKISKHELPL